MIFIVYLTKTSYLCHINNKNCKMKKIFTLAFIALTLLATACGKSNDENSKPQDDAKKALIGTWRIEAVMNNITGERTLTECDKKQTLVFREDNIFIQNDPPRGIYDPNGSCNTKELKGKFSVSGTTLIIEGNTYHYSISENELTIILERQEAGLKIIETSVYKAVKQISK